jgi:hypothetical protein
MMIGITNGFPVFWRAVFAFVRRPRGPVVNILPPGFPLPVF